MFKPAKMQKVRIIALKSVISEVIKLLHELGLVEITVSHYEHLEHGRPLEYYNEVSEQLVNIRALKSLLTKSSTVAIENMTGTQAVEATKNLRLADELNSLNSELNSNETLAVNLKEQIKLVEQLSGFSDIDFSKLETSSVSYSVGFLKAEKFDMVKIKLDSTSKTYNMRFSSEKGVGILLVVYKKSDADITNLLSEYGFLKITVPQSLTTSQKTLTGLHTQIDNITLAIASLKQRITELSSKNYSKVASLEKALTIEADRAEIASKFSSTSSVYIVDGWIKDADSQKLEHSIAAKFGEKAIVEKTGFDPHHEVPPTVFDNPGTASPFEFITRNYSLPNSLEIDPTVLYLFTIPFIYGMIVGDVGYAILSIFISKFIMGKFKNSPIMTSVAKIWFLSAFPAMLFGVIFDEWMGASHLHWFEVLAKWGLDLGVHASLYTGLSRIHELTTVIGITCIVGLIHLGLGFLLGAINEWNHSKKHVLAKFSWIGIEIGGTLTIASLMLNVLPLAYALPGEILLVISIIVLALTEGVVGLLELPGLAGNILSYARIAAIGVVGVILAEIINEFLVPVPEQGIFGLLLIPLLLAFHAINTFIAMFESLIQGGRLNILEFRSKFLKGGGKMFEPFVME
ncbi:MAG: V-type ATPase 116kDa subunit family protein [Candidatus Micrarchaeota archaeon]|nr:V-type ATPase 116kDa subunit family protein [Candidatus Micrarchaeota archaeon]